MNRRQLLKGLIALPVAGAAAALAIDALPDFPTGWKIVEETDEPLFYGESAYDMLGERYARDLDSSLRLYYDELAQAIYSGPTTDAGLTQLVRSG